MRRAPLVLVDGAQAVPHLRVDVQDIDCDFLAFSGHKVYAPMGIGALYGKEKLLDAMPPWMGGGEMIRSVSLESSTWNDLPWKFEAGTPNVEGAVGLSAAIDYLHALGLRDIAAWEEGAGGVRPRAAGRRVRALTLYGAAPRPQRRVPLHPRRHPRARRRAVPGPRRDRRAGRPPLRAAAGAAAWACRRRPARASAFYNTFSEIDRLADALEGALRFYA